MQTHTPRHTHTHTHSGKYLKRQHKAQSRVKTIKSNTQIKRFLQMWQQKRFFISICCSSTLATTTNTEFFLLLRVCKQIFSQWKTTTTTITNTYKRKLTNSHFAWAKEQQNPNDCIALRWVRQDMLYGWLRYFAARV